MKNYSASRLLITESGIATPDDVRMMQEHDIHSFLVGESFMKQPRPDQAFTALLDNLKRFNEDI